MARMPVHALRVPDDEWDAWEAAARDQGDSVASLIRDVMNAHVAAGASPAKARPRGKAARAEKAKASAQAECERAHFHRPGVFCKACGITPA